MNDFKFELSRIAKPPQPRPKPVKPRRQRRAEARNLAKAQKKNG